MRVFEISAGEHTLKHSHDQEHEMFIQAKAKSMAMADGIQ
jgi:hypothetical protein